jgi:hypothetical protein
MKRTIQEVLEELETDFRDLKAYIDENSKESWDLNDGVLRGIIKRLINDYMIPELKELSELLEMEEKKKC